MLNQKTARRMAAPLLAAAALGLTLAGCGSSSDDESAAAPSETVTMTSSPSPSASTSPDSASEGSSEDAGQDAAQGAGQTAGNASEPPFTVRYTDDYKTVLTFTPQQIAQLTGQDVSGGDADALDTALGVFADQATWQGFDGTSSDAEVIAAAAERESDSIRKVLTVESKGGQLGLKLYVAHHEHAHVAHFNPNH